MSLLLNSNLMASEPTEAAIAERRRIGIEAYARVMDALEVPGAQRLSAETVTAHSGSNTPLEAMQTKREAQRQALEGEGHRFEHINLPGGELANWPNGRDGKSQ